MDRLPVRILDVHRSEMNEGLAKHLATLLAELAQDPSRAKQSRGQFILQFPDSELAERPNYAVPEIRGFVKALDRACPYMCYFLNEDPSISQIQFFLLCLVNLQHTDQGWLYNPEDLMKVATDRFTQVANFCRQIGEDENLGTDGILMNLPAQILVEQPELSAKVLRTMKPALVALKRDFDDLRMRPDGREVIKNILGRAAILSGLTKSRLDENLLDKILLRVA